MTDTETDKLFYNRNPGEIAVLLDIYDAETLTPDKFGSRQFFLVTLREKFTAMAQKTELYKLKGYFAKRNLLEDVTIEYIGENCICVLCPYNLKGLTKLQKDYDSGRLNRYFVECLITDSAKKKLEVSDMKMKIKISLDEFQTVKKEWESGVAPVPYDLNKNENAMRMLKIVRTLQLAYLQDPDKGVVQQMRDSETKFEQHLTNLITLIKRIRVGGLEPIKGIAEVCELTEKYRKTDGGDIHLLDHYLDTVKSANKAVRHVETTILFPLSQIRIGGENKSQMEKKELIFKLIHDSKELLRDDALFTAKIPQFTSKITKSERFIFDGFVSYLPSAVRSLLDLDEAIDEYFQSGNVQLKTSELRENQKQI